MLGFAALSVGVLGAGASTGGGPGVGSPPGELALAAEGSSDGHDHPHDGDAHAHDTSGSDHAHGDGASHAAGAPHAHGPDGGSGSHGHDDHPDSSGGHDHAVGGATDDHGDHHHPGGTTPGADGHDHAGGSSGPGGGDHDHGGDGGGGLPGPGDHDHDHDEGTGTGATPEQEARAAALLAATEASIPKWASTRAAHAAGFRSIGDAVTGFEHWVNWEWFLDDVVLDPEHPESLVYRVLSDGTRVLESAMYILPLGATMADVPDVGGPLTPWHIHDNLCWDFSRPTPIVVATTVSGVCPIGTLFVTPPMLHVWIVDTPCGRFAEIEGVQGTASCDHHHQG
ncbi:hypothetical protein [Rhabdothermincola sediminis]|uniref:hypothetical protein n=1 Tax=Rhabdothermincola sediminis TaxID=2751370 RepID=UPI001AA05E06|nr:hypothetical protein [Rhabdothermincola sediminis]